MNQQYKSILNECLPFFSVLFCCVHVPLGGPDVVRGRQRQNALVCALERQFDQLIQNATKLAQPVYYLVTVVCVSSLLLRRLKEGWGGEESMVGHDDVDVRRGKAIPILALTTTTTVTLPRWTSVSSPLET